MSTYEPGDIYWVESAYEDAPNESKRRPAIIVAETEEHVFLLVTTTSKGPKNPPKYYDRYKHPILNWRQANLYEPSWAKCNALVELPKHILNDYIGKLHEFDYRRLIDFLETEEE